MDNEPQYQRPKNPYEAEGGGPIHGQAKLFFDFSRDRYLKWVATLPVERQQRIFRSERALARRMSS
jgi:hypothetical protein